MKNSFLILFIFIGVCAFAQPSALLRKETAARLDKIRWKLSSKAEERFDTIIEQRHKDELLKRLDTLAYDNFYLLEMYRVWDDSVQIDYVERYYKAGNPLPVYTFYNGKPEVADSADSLAAIKNKFRKIYSGKNVAYEKRPVFYRGCVVNPKRDRMLIESSEKNIKNTYIVATALNKQTAKVKITFQRPPRRVKIRPKYRGLDF